LLLVTHEFITSHHMEKTEAGLKGFCIRIILLIHKIVRYSTTVSDAMEICFIIVQHVLITPEFKCRLKV